MCPRATSTRRWVFRRWSRGSTCWRGGARKRKPATGTETDRRGARLMPPEEADLNVARRDGRERWKHLNALPIKQIHDRLISQYDGHALSIIDRLMSDLEG
ncbi:hypothetical protein [Mesorhizobium australicum]|uniref:hypothetical protein n=1 Tax=Mesorhizobium australicum TaxID=536018 RepID=UPI003EB740BD